MAGGPHWASPEAVIGAQPGSRDAVEQVAVTEVFDEEAVGVAPVVEDLAALDVAADAPRSVVSALEEVLTARGEGVEVG